MKTKKISPLRQFLSFVLSVGLIVQAPMALAGAEPAPLPLVGIKSADAELVLNAYNERVNDEFPFLADFLKSEVPAEIKAIKFESSDASLDLNPFFMREQKWINSAVSRADHAWGVATESTSSTVKLGSWEKALILPEAFYPVADTPEFILLSAKDKKLFAQKHPANEVEGGGLFILVKNELKQKYAASLKGLSGPGVAAPVYFLPLPEEAWSGALTATYLSNTDQILVSSETKEITLPIDVSDLVQVVKFQKMNLFLARAQNALHNKQQVQESIKAKFQQGLINFSDLPFPATKSTAGFGSVLTNLNTADNAYQVAELSKSIMNYVFPKAHADPTSLITADAFERLIFLGQILGGTFLGAVALKYTKKYREIFNQKYGDNDPSSRFKKEVKGVFDIYSHSLGVLASTISITNTNILEYLGDRFATRKMGPKNGMVRRIFNNTLGWSKENASRLAVNYHTFWLGAIVMGAVDTTLVVSQLLFVTPFIIEAINGVESKPTDSEGATAQFVTSEIVRNIIGYLQYGALDYSGTQKFLVQNKVNREVDDQMENEKLDPRSPKNAGQRAKLIAQKMDSEMRKRGLPSNNEFLFDTNTITEDLMQRKGYTVSGLGTPKATAGSYLLEKGRWGLMIPALRDAKRYVDTLAKEAPSELSGQVLQGFTSLSKKLKMATFKRAERKQLKKALTLLSYGGDVSQISKYLPQEFKDLAGSEQATQLMAEIYNKALYSILEGNSNILAPSKELRAKYRMQAIEKTFALKKKSNSFEAASFSDAFNLAHQRNQFVAELHLADLQQKSIEAYKPVRKNAIEKFQLDRAHRMALAEFNAEINAKNEKAWLETYGRNYAASFGLLTKNSIESKFVKAVVEATYERLVKRLDKPEEKNYLNKLDAEGQLQFKSRIYGEYFVETYNEFSQSEGLKLDAFSVEQPGRFQWLRTKMLDWKIGSVGTKLLRGTEALFSKEAQKTGLMPWMDRNIPLWNDAYHNFAKSLRTMPYTLSLGYLTAYYVWQVKMDYAVFGLFVGLSFTGTMAIESLNRGMQNFGVKPMAGTWSKVKYAFMHSWLTFPVFIPVMMYAEPVTVGFDKYVKGPLRGAWGYLFENAAVVSEKVVSFCERALM